MGMFDEIRFEVPIPGEPKPKRLSFQTKDFNCLLDSYVVEEDGSLVCYGEEARPGIKVPFHGMLNFYTLESESPRGPSMWFEYEAKFTDGRLRGIECVRIHRNTFGVQTPEVIYDRDASKAD